MVDGDGVTYHEQGIYGTNKDDPLRPNLSLKYINLNIVIIG